MRFGGLQKNSFIDYPKKISCVVFVSGCNFRCPFCHNPDLLNPSHSAFSRKEILQFLEARTGLLDAVVISGGEPTMQVDLLGFCEKVKAMGYLLKVDTNGSQPPVIRQLVKNGLVDYLAMDIKTLPEKYEPDVARKIAAETINESIYQIMNSGVDYEFRTTCVQPLIDASIMTRIGQMVNGARRYALQQLRQNKVLDPDYFVRHAQQPNSEDITAFKKIMSRYVHECIVR